MAPFDRASEDAIYDVAIVGGRPAGASLALRLGAAGLRVLVLDRADFPSRPAVSAPFLLPHALMLLDELGLDERAYAADTPRLHRFVLEFAGYFRTQLSFDEPVGGRTHFYAIDRARLDLCLWQALARYPNVTTRSGAHFVAVSRDADGSVNGVRVRQAEGEQVLQARAVIGADGRNSAVATAVGARQLLERTDAETSLYYSHWRDVAAYEAGAGELAHIHTSCDGFSFVFMPSADGETMVVAQGRSDRYLALQGSPQEVYLRLLQARPRVWRRLQNARQVSALSGIKHMGNAFRQPFGPGWALVGDAYHQKDSLDAQGIYDALLGAKLLAAQLIAWHQGRAWPEALAVYEASAWSAFKPMFDATMERVKRELYAEPPPVVIRSLLRYVLTDPEYSRRFMRVATRTLAPEQLLPPRVLLRLAARGGLRHAKQTLLRMRSVRNADPTDALPL
jgi:2-polyprenyl-6-methoxyphenol hydroxylase-like FAD-dependent oxidoreductase